MAGWVDTHCHLGYGDTHDPSTALAEARAAGVTRVITVGTDADESRRAVALAAAEPDVWATVGLHPHEASRGVVTIVPVLDEGVGAGVVVAVGECGLDYHYDHSPRRAQREAFAAQIALAHERRLALVVHAREAWDDVFAILESEGVPEATVFHCFTGGPAEAERALLLGAHLSFSGIVTFPKADEVRAACARCPLDRLLVETDAPYLAPVPHRGRPNRPAWLPAVAAGVAAARGQPVEEIRRAVWANAERVFRLQ